MWEAACSIMDEPKRIWTDKEIDAKLKEVAEVA